MSQPARQQLLEAYLARLSDIQIANGYQTDVGANPTTQIILGESVELGKDDPDVAIAIVIGDEEVRRSDENVFSFLPVEFQGLAKIAAGGFTAAYLAAEALLGDIKKAIEQPDRGFGGLVRPRIERALVRTLPRQPGSTTAGVGITYLAPRLEKWGAP